MLLCMYNIEFVGSIVTVHCESIIECHDSTMSSELPEIELMVSDQLNNEVSQEHDLHFQGSSLASLHSQAIHFVGASPTGSIYVFFFCETFNSVIGLKQMVQSGYLKTLLEDIFNRILGSTSIWLRLIVTLDDTVYTKSIEEARETSKDLSVQFHHNMHSSQHNQHMLELWRFSVAEYLIFDSFKLLM